MYDSSSGKDPGAAKGCAGIRTVIRFSAAAIRPRACGCRRGVCVGACPEKVQALKMVPQETQLDQQDVFNYCVEKVSEKKELQTPDVKGSQFRKPLLEFTGSCAGCAETSYARLVTQLFGDKSLILLMLQFLFVFLQYLYLLSCIIPQMQVMLMQLLKL